jgi:hypothetical protein
MSRVKKLHMHGSIGTIAGGAHISPPKEVRICFVPCITGVLVLDLTIFHGYSTTRNHSVLSLTANGLVVCHRPAIGAVPLGHQRF